MEDEGEIQLGGNITLSGFKNIEPAKMVVVKKIVGNCIKKVQDKNVGFESVSLNLKKVHDSEFEIKCKLFLNGKLYHSDSTGFNLFVVLNDVLEKVVGEAGVG
ncbi:MAG: hypothetical protein KKG60_03025 [Nanoarchaeota archaeon]|nr:hypothetical protein [Nanoarchaeota archaeon]